MPGSSLWLLPPADHPLNSLLTTAISKTSTHFSSPHHFIPHITLTSLIDPSTYASEPQKWLDSVPFPSKPDVVVRFGPLASEDVFVRKLYIKVEIEGVLQAGKVARMTVNGYEEEDVAGKFGPHLSLL
jgi:2',3'-cyclic-nucleotide 3'-phosphodiesterase